MCSLDGADSGTNSDVLVSLPLDVGILLECLWNVCSFTVLTLLSISNIILENRSWELENGPQHESGAFSLLTHSCWKYSGYVFMFYCLTMQNTIHLNFITLFHELSIFTNYESIASFFIKIKMSTFRNVRKTQIF